MIGCTEVDPLCFNQHFAACKLQGFRSECSDAAQSVAIAAAVARGASSPAECAQFDLCLSWKFRRLETVPTPHQSSAYRIAAGASEAIFRFVH